MASWCTNMPPAEVYSQASGYIHINLLHNRWYNWHQTWGNSNR